MDENTKAPEQNVDQEVQPSEQDTQKQEPQSKTFTRDEVNRMIAAEKKKADDAAKQMVARQKQLNEETLSESERLQTMTAEEKAKYFEDKYKQAEQARQRDKEVESLRSQTVSMLAENKIPDAFLSVFGFENATAEDIKQRVAMLSEYEYYPKGELDKRVQAAVAEKLKTDPIKTHGAQQRQNTNDPFVKGFDKQ